MGVPKSNSGIVVNNLGEIIRKVFARKKKILDAYILYSKNRQKEIKNYPGFEEDIKQELKRVDTKNQERNRELTKMQLLLEAFRERN